MGFSAYEIDKVVTLRNEQYFTFLNGMIQKARKRIWAAIFIVNPTVEDDYFLTIRNLLKILTYALWRNVDVRVLIGQSEAFGISTANETAFSYLHHLGVPVRKFIGQYRRSMHSKYVVIDDELLICGSHNWTPGAANLHEEDSIAVFSEEMNLLLRDEFISHWQYADPIKTEN